MDKRRVHIYILNASDHHRAAPTRFGSLSPAIWRWRFGIECVCVWVSRYIACFCHGWLGSTVSTEAYRISHAPANVTYANGRECRRKNNHHKELWLYPSYLKRFNHIYIALHKKIAALVTRKSFLCREQSMGHIHGGVRNGSRILAPLVQIHTRTNGTQATKKRKKKNGKNNVERRGFYASLCYKLQPPGS